MAITEERLKEMEEEMNRFEEEISTVHPPMSLGHGGAQKLIIGSNTYHQVQAKLTHHHDDDTESRSSPSGPPQRPTEPPRPPVPPKAPPLVMAEPQMPFPRLPPPPPPPIDTSTSNSQSLQPPPPPPRPAFVPHQIRHRPPPPPMGGRGPYPYQGMPRPPMGGPPHGMHPPPPMRGPGPGHGHQHGPFMPGPGPGMHPGGPGGPGMHPGGPPGGPGMPHPHGPRMPPPMPYNPMYQSSQPPQMYGPPEPKPQNPAVIQGSKVVYSSPPVKNTPTTSAPVPTKVVEPEPVQEEVIADPEPEPIVVPEVSVPGEIEDPMSEDIMMELEEAGDGSKRDKKSKKPKYMRTAAGITWEDPTLSEWDNDDFRVFCGDLGNEVTEEILARAFSRYPSFVRAKVVRDKRTNKTRGYGFIAFTDPNDFVRAMREMNGKYVGNRPIKLRKSAWKDRNSEIVKKKEKEKKRLGFR